jgi:aldehyde dehydrogenase (NAD+)
VLKPAELTPLTATILGEVTAAAGLPAGALNIVHGLGSVVGEAISRHPGIAMVSFTGSTATGRLVAAAAAGTIKKVGLELGGKSPNVVLRDADFALAARLGLGSAWFNSGQICAAWTRMLVPADKHDEIVELLVTTAKNFTVGDPTDDDTVLGPVVSEAARDKIVGFIERAVDAGARVAFSGTVPDDGGAYVRPTILCDVDPDSELAQEEIFGPVLAVIPYADEEEAVEIANNSKYGLAGAVFGEQDRAIAIARRIRTGSVQINAAGLDLRLPVGGYKMSGNGARDLGTLGLEEYLEVKSLQI